MSGDQNLVAKISSKQLFNIQSIVASMGKSIYLSKKSTNPAPEAMPLSSISKIKL